MAGISRKDFMLGLAIGVGAAAAVAFMMGQGASQPVKSETQYFVTAEGDNAHLWVREGSALRVVGHGQCTKCPWDDHDHKDGGHHQGDGHEHSKDAPKK